VVVGQVGGGGRHEQLALGETPNVAARLQNVAEPDRVVISAATHRLVDGFFRCRILARKALKGASEPMRAFEVVEEGPSRSRLDVATPAGLTPLVGREQEVGLLLDRWEQACEGPGIDGARAGDANCSASIHLAVARPSAPEHADGGALHGEADRAARRAGDGGKSLPAEVLQQIVARTDGVPLFVEELTKMVLESGLLREVGGRYELTGPLPPLAIPTTLQDSLMSRLDWLAQVKEVAQLGATVGRALSRTP
jgi:hypothetical protein